MCTLEKRGKIFFLTLNSDPQNRLSPTLIASIRASLAQARSQAQPGCALITLSSSPKFFSNGLDLVHARRVGASDPKAGVAELGNMVSLFKGVVADLISMPMPTIAAVAGHAAAAGMMLALCHDYVIMTKSKGVMYMSEVDIGMSLPDYFGAVLKWKVGGRLGWAGAREVLLWGKKVGGSEGVELGFVDEVAVSGEEVVETAEKVAEQLAVRGWSGEAYSAIRMGLCPDVCGLVGLEAYKVVAPSKL